MKKTTFTLILIFLISACSPQNPTSQTDLNYDVAQESYQFQFLGNPYEISVDNCNGARDSIKTEERSQKYIVELHIDITNEIASEIGGDIEVARITLAREIGRALGVQVGTETTTTSSVQVITPAGKKTVTSVQWKETWVQGKIAVIRPDGSYVGVIPFIVLNSLSLDQLGSQTYDCETGIVVPITPTPPTSASIEPSSVLSTNKICGQEVSSESLASCIGGNAAYWTQRGPDVWGYWDEGNKVTFRHPGGSTILSYWAGFPDPRNADGCQIVVVQSEDTKYVKCAIAGAEFESDGVGFHLVDHTNIFK